MEDKMVFSSQMMDKNGEVIVLGDCIQYEGNPYMVISTDKDDISWLAHPCGNNPKTLDLNLEDIAGVSERI